MRFSNIQLLPALWVMTSKILSGATPARIPSAMASAAAAMCTPASSWFTIFTVLPAPARSPSR